MCPLGTEQVHGHGVTKKSLKMLPGYRTRDRKVVQGSLAGTTRPEGQERRVVARTPAVGDNNPTGSLSRGKTSCNPSRWGLGYLYAQRKLLMLPLIHQPVGDHTGQRMLRSELRGVIGEWLTQSAICP